MRNSIRLSAAYLKYYKKQTLALFLGIVLSAGLLAGVGSLMWSGEREAMESVRGKYGDWHYSMRCDYPWFSEFEEHRTGKGYRVERAGVMTIRKMLEEPYDITMLYADDEYLRMMGRKLEMGHYPEEKNEVAMDTYSIRNMEIPEVLGSTVLLDGEEFVLSGILSDMPEAETMQVFVSGQLDYGTNGRFLYLKFDESAKVYPQMLKFTEALGIEKSSTSRNMLNRYVGGDVPPNIWDIIKTGISMEGTGIPYIWSMLNQNWNLTEKAVLGSLGLFGVFIIYSLFQVSVTKRMSQYSVMQAVGMTRGTTFGVLASELALIFIPGYLTGCLAGNGLAAVLYRRSGRIFVQPEEFYIHSGVEAAQAGADLPQAQAFHVSTRVMAWGAVFFLLLILLIAWKLVRKMDKMTTRELLVKESGKKRKNRTIYSLKYSNLTGILTKKFMFERKGAFAAMLLSLAVGSLIFLGASYVAENTKRNNELTFKADDGLGSDIQIYEQSDVLSDVVPEHTVEQLKGLQELKSVSPVSYMLGELPLSDGRLKWTKYYAEVAEEEGFEPDPELMEKYNGVAVRTGSEDYKLKVNIYGYDDGMLEALNEYLLEGEIDPEQMRKQNTVIFKTLMGGQGTYEGVDIGTGDTISLKTPLTPEAPPEVLRFLSADDQYREQEFEVTALTSRPLAKVDTFIEDNGTNRIDIIMTNEQMKQNFGTEGYHTVSISLDESADSEAAADAIRTLTSGIPKCVVEDYTQRIEAQNMFLKQKMLFFYGVALILLVISLVHIMNSMQYLVTARKHEFGILRAMGITEQGFRKMLLREGLRYGVYSAAVMTVLYLILQKILYYFMVRVYLYIHPDTHVSFVHLLIMAGVNICICIFAVLISGQSILKEQIIDEIHE